MFSESKMNSQTSEKKQPVTHSMVRTHDSLLKAYRGGMNDKFNHHIRKLQEFKSQEWDLI